MQAFPIIEQPKASTNSTNKMQEFQKISSWKLKRRVEITYLGGENDEQNWKLDDEIMQDEAQGWQNSVKIWKIWGKNWVGFVGSWVEEEEEEVLCVCVREGEEGNFFFKFCDGAAKAVRGHRFSGRPTFNFFFLTCRK